MKKFMTVAAATAFLIGTAASGIAQTGLGVSGKGAADVSANTPGQVQPQGSVSGNTGAAATTGSGVNAGAGAKAGAGVKAGGVNADTNLHGGAKANVK